MAIKVKWPYRLHMKVVCCYQVIIFQVKDSLGPYHKIWAILDDDSTTSFVTDRLCAKLNLTTSSTSSFVEGLNGLTSPLNKRYDVVISSLYKTYTKHTSCLSVTTISHSLPTVYHQYNITSHIQVKWSNLPYSNTSWYIAWSRYILGDVRIQTHTIV